MYSMYVRTLYYTVHQFVQYLWSRATEMSVIEVSVFMFQSDSGCLSYSMFSGLSRGL
jgi:hypothetical protein